MDFAEKTLLKKMQDIYKTEHTKKLIEMVKKIMENFEFETSINRTSGINYSQYMDVAKYMINRAKEEELLNEVTLDISYAYSSTNTNNYRITIVGEDRINKIMNNLTLRKNHSIFSILTNNIINQAKDDADNMFIIHKIKDRTNIVDLNEYDIRFRLAQENDVDKQTLNELLNLSEGERNKITYRFKERLSYIINVNDEVDIRIDLTNIKQNMFFTKLPDSSKMYELELEIIKKSKKTFSQESAEHVYNKLLLEIYRIHQLLQKSTKIITVSSKNSLLAAMNELLYNNPSHQAKDLPGMSVVSLENQHVTSDLTYNYSVSDKSDGERFFMMIFQGKIFLISNNLDIKEIDGSSYNNLNKYNNTIIDGEYMFLHEQNKFVFLGFDILFYNGKDLRDEPNLEIRIEKLNDVMKTCFDNKTMTNKFTGAAKLPDLIAHYKKQILAFFDELNTKLEKQSIVIMCQTYFIPLGLYPSELYAYSELVWNLYTMDKSVNCPYKLDGIIYTPLNQKYTRNIKDIRYQIYKWKPSSFNSIDFYITFEKNQDTRQILNVYDNSFEKTQQEDNDVEESDILDDTTQYRSLNKVYRICNLQVGSMKTGNEQPVLFDKDNNLYLAYLYLQDGEVRDVEGNIIQDNTVVEFVYKNDPKRETAYNWVPLRTRYDKTESVIKHQRKYGNNEFIANKIWRSMSFPFEFHDIQMLAKPDAFDSYMNDNIRPRVTKEIIVSERAEKKYYEKDSKLLLHMRSFHNFIKTNLISTYCGPKFINNSFKSLDILDVGAGRGGDLMKYYHARVNSITCFDPDYENVFSSTDGIVSRYNDHKRNKTGFAFPNTTIFIADAKALFNMQDQEKVIGVISDTNKTTIKQVFGENNKSTKYKMFDIFSCQFMLHYLFASDESINNFCENIKKFLKKDGYLIATLNDGNMLHNAFVNGMISHYYVDGSNKKLLFEYKQLYKDKDLNKTGLAIDYYNASFMSEGTYITEYLVTSEFMINTLESKADLILIETDTFENQYNLQKEFIHVASQNEANVKTKDQFNKIKQFYNLELDDNTPAYELSRVNRYYVFQKK